jgi:hypothetical protein
MATTLHSRRRENTKPRSSVQLISTTVPQTLRIMTNLRIAIEIVHLCKEEEEEDMVVEKRRTHNMAN